MSSNKSHLLALVEQAHTAYQAFVDGLSAAERAEVGTLEKWSAKDLLAHTAFWNGLMHKRLVTIRQGEIPSPTTEADLEQANGSTFEEHRNDTWQEVLSQAESAYQTILADIQGFSEEEITKPGSFSQADRTIQQSVTGTCYVHTQQHYTDYCLERGDVARAGRIQERMAEGLAQSGDLYSQSIAKYNLACFYARTAQPEHALALLPDALRATPSLLEWSKEDPDLISLHDHPDYKALYPTA